MGDMVYLKLQPYVQSSVAPREAHKLSFKFFGPYMILARVGKVAYKLQLPSSATIHPDTLSHIQVTLQALDRRVILRGGKQIQQVLIKWSQGDDALATWEDEEALRARFPTSEDGPTSKEAKRPRFWC